MITKRNIYNFKDKGKTRNAHSQSVTVDSMLELRRAIPIESLAGITKLLNPESYEFVIHVERDYDYRLVSEQ